MPDKKWLEATIAKLDKQYNDNWRAFQETGMSRYGTAYRKAEDMADALRTALAAKDDHDKLITMRGNVAIWRSQADQIIGSGDYERTEALLKDIAAMARIWGC